jgi:RNA polymerase sigma-70 factor, ECF subfamily
VDLNDEALIEKFLTTHEITFYKALVRRHQNRVYSAAFRILGNVEEAEEVVQDTFVRVHQNLDRFRHQSSFSSWLFRICHNLCMDLMRLKQRRSGVLTILPFETRSQEEPELPLSRLNQMADEMPGPAQLLEEIEQGQMIAESLQKLPQNQRVVLVLHDIEGFSYQEIADIVGERIGTVRSRLHYGRLKLRELLDPYFSFTTVTTASR